MKQVVPFQHFKPGAQAVPRVLYVGPAPDELCEILSNHIGRVELAYEQDVQAAFAQLRRRQFDTVIVDQRDENLATRLILPVLQSVGYPVKPVVISPLSDVSHYLAIPGVARVLSAPVKELQLLRILGLERRHVREPEAVPTATPVQPKRAAKSPGLVQSVINRFMNLVSTLYKRAAFVLLFALFVAFAFYGVLIGFFLLSSGWGAPMTLTRGHEMVNRVEREITEIQVALNQTQQRLDEGRLAKVTAEQDLRQADEMVAYAAGTVKQEMQARQRQAKVLTQNVKRLRKTRKLMENQIASKNQRGNPGDLFARRLIDRNAFSSAQLSMLEVERAIGNADSELDIAESQLESLALSQGMLSSLDKALATGNNLEGISATASDLLLLAKQASDALVARNSAKARLINSDENDLTLRKSLSVLGSQLATLQQSALARALQKRIDVVFVPYGNERDFAEGSSVYSCAFTILWCTKAGVAAKPLPGEISSVHPFFGKPIRGIFVEVHLDNETAAMNEIIHGKRKPFFF